MDRRHGPPAGQNRRAVRQSYRFGESPAAACGRGASAMAHRPGSGESRAATGLHGEDSRHIVPALERAGLPPVCAAGIHGTSSRLGRETLLPEAKNGQPSHMVPTWERKTCTRSRLGRTGEKGHTIYLRKRRKSRLSKTVVFSQGGTLRADAGDSAPKTPLFSRARSMLQALSWLRILEIDGWNSGFEPMRGHQKRKTSLVAR